MRKDLSTIVLILSNDVFLGCSQKISSPRRARSQYKKLMKILGINISCYNQFRQLWRALGIILISGPNDKRFERKKPNFCSYSWVVEYVSKTKTNWGWARTGTANGSYCQSLVLILIPIKIKTKRDNIFGLKPNIRFHLPPETQACLKLPKLLTLTSKHKRFIYTRVIIF